MRYLSPPENQDTLAGGLLRQRRNLLIICIILVIYDLGKIEILRSGNIAGLSYKIENPDALIMLLWGMFFYFSFRYLQYFLTIGKGKFDTQLIQALEKHCNPIIKLKIDSLDPKVQHSDNPAGNYRDLSQHKWMFNYSIVGDDQTANGNNHPRHLKIGWWQLRNGIVKAWIEILFFKTGGTDYLLPFLIAIAVLIYCNVDYLTQSFYSLTDLLRIV